MENQAKLKWKLGLFVTIGVILLIAVLFYIGKQKNLFGSVFRLKSYFNNVSGLKIGNNVRFGGINVGTVDDIQLSTDTTVMVEMVMQKKVQRFIKKDALVSIGSDGLMGDRVLIIVPGIANQPVADEDAVLASKAPVETEQILAGLKTSADNAAIITQNLADIAHKLNKGNGLIARLIGDSSLSNNLNKTVVNLRKGSEGLNENMEAAKHNFLLKGYFKKKKKAEEKKKKELEEQQEKEKTETKTK
jgi:phospholipid/cholesterol/gamma-HCH transport system substrate-binding protein